MTNILVTGAAGFIGSHLVERLLTSTAYELGCVDNFSDDYAPTVKQLNTLNFRNHNRVRFFEADFGDVHAMTRTIEEFMPSKVVHLGAHAGVAASVKTPLRYFENNVIGTLNLLEALRGRSLDRFIYISSSTVYGRDCPVPFRENGPLGTPASPYGASKRSAELLCETYALLHSIPVVILRLFSVIGPRLRPDLAMSIFAECISKHQDIIVFGDGTVRRDFTHVQDICTGIISAIETPTAVGECINLGHDCPITMNELLNEMQAAFGQKTSIVYRPSRAEDLPVTHADLTKAREILDYNPSISFGQGVKDFASWYASLGNFDGAQGSL